MKKFTLFFFSLFLMMGTAIAQDEALALVYAEPSNGKSLFSVYNIRLEFNKHVSATLPEGGIDVKNNTTGEVYKLTRVDDNEWLEKTTVVLLFEQKSVVGKEGKEELVDQIIESPGDYSYTIPAGCIKSVDGEDFAEYTSTFKIAAAMDIEGVSPDEPTTKLDKISFSFAKAIAKVEIPSSGLHILDNYWMPATTIKNEVTFSEDKKTVTLELAEPITTPGHYNLDIYQGVFVSVDGEINQYSSYSFEVIDPNPSFATNYSDGDKVKEIGDLEITFQNVNNVALVAGADPVMAYLPGGGEAEGTATLAGNKITVKFNQKFTEEGDYLFYIPAGTFTMDGVANEAREINVTLYSFSIVPLEIVSITPVAGYVEQLDKIVIEFNQNITPSYDEDWQMISYEVKLKSGDQVYTMTYCPSNYNISNKLEYLVNAEWNGYEYASTPITTEGTYTLNLADIVVDHAGEDYIDEWGYPNTKWHSKNKACQGNVEWTVTVGGVAPAPEGIDTSKAYRIKEVTSGNYLHVGEYNADNSTGPVGSVIISEYAESNDQIFNFEEAADGDYYVKSLNGHYIVCRSWNVDACDDGQKTPLGFEFTEDNQFRIINTRGYFKVESVSGVVYPFCDAALDLAATWVLEEAVASGIEDINAVEGTGAIYDLTGRKIEKITNAGIYIVGGKKVLVK